MRHADALARLIRGMHCRVNLIRFHAIPGVEELQPCGQHVMVAFRDRLNQLGVTATIRASRGEDIMQHAACLPVDRKMHVGHRHKRSGVMADHYDGRAALFHLLENPCDHVAVMGVEIAHRFVKNKY